MNEKLSSVPAFVLLWALFVALPSGASIRPGRKLLKVDHLARIQLGDSIDAVPSISSERTHFKLRHRLARFHLYYFDPSLPGHCMNLQCGTFAIRVIAHGGFLMGGADVGYLSDIEGASHDPVLLVTDRSDRVEAIYRDIARQDLRTALREVLHDPALR